MGTRYPPYSDPTWWQSTQTAGSVGLELRMNSAPHNELFGMALHHLVAWVTDGVVPPRAARMEVGDDGFFAKDECGNSLGGVRNVLVDVPAARFYANPRNSDGTPAFGVVGFEESLSHDELARLYRDHDDYVQRFTRRLDELVTDGWLLADDAPELREEAEKAEVP
jgi:hypothetical protein